MGEKTPETELRSQEHGSPLEIYDSFLKEHKLEDNLLSSAVYQVYQDLRLVRGWTNLRVVFSTARHRPYVCGSAAVGFDTVFPGKENEQKDRTQAVVPIPNNESQTPTSLNGLVTDFPHPETGKKLRCVTMAVVDGDSTTAYYRIFDDFDEVLHPQWKQKRDEKDAASDDES